jgi:hypothetical protein
MTGSTKDPCTSGTVAAATLVKEQSAASLTVAAEITEQWGAEDSDRGLRLRHAHERQRAIRSQAVGWANRA